MKTFLTFFVILFVNLSFCEEAPGVVDLGSFTGDGGKALTAAYAIPERKASQEKKLVDLTKSLFEKKSRDDNEQHRLLACIAALGFMSIKFSVNEVLLPHLSYEREIAFTGRTPLPLHDYPCVGALIDVGFSALPDIIVYLKSKHSDFEIKLTLYVIQSICAKISNDPKKSTIAKKIISCCIDNSEGEEKKNLEKALFFLSDEIPSTIKP